MSHSRMNSVSETASLNASEPAMTNPGQRYAAFKRHVVSCPACSAAHVEMCNQGYWLLIGALGIVAAPPLAAA